MPTFLQEFLEAEPEALCAAPCRARASSPSFPRRRATGGGRPAAGDRLRPRLTTMTAHLFAVSGLAVTPGS